MIAMERWGRGCGWVENIDERIQNSVMYVGGMTSKDLVYCIVTILTAIQCSFEDCYDSRFKCSHPHI